MTSSERMFDRVKNSSNAYVVFIGVKASQVWTDAHNGPKKQKT